MDQNSGQNDQGMEPWQERQKKIRLQIEMQNRRQHSANMLCLISSVCGIMSLVLFLLFINIPLAVVSLITGVIGLQVKCQYGVLARIGIAASVLSVVMFFGGWMIIGAHVPTEGLDNNYLQELMREQSGGETI